MNRNEYLRSLEERLDNWDVLLDTLKRGRENASDGMAEEYSAAIASLDAKRREASDKLVELRQAPEDESWESLREAAEHLWNEVTDTLERTRTEFLAGLRDD